MNPTPSIRRSTLAGVAVSLLSLALLMAPATASAASEEAQSFWDNLFGKQLKLKGTPIVYDEAAGDTLTSNGQPVEGVGFADAVDFAYLVTDLKKPQVNALAKKQRGKKVNAIRGAKASPKAGQTWVFVGARTAEDMPGRVPGGVQLTAAFDGIGAVPLYGGGSADIIAGRSDLITSGQYDGSDLYLSGHTKTTDTPRGGRPDYNNTPARTSGLQYDNVWVVGLPLPKGAQVGSFGLQTVSDGAQVMDRFTTLGGVTSFPLAGPAVPDDLCYSGSIYSILDANGDIVEYNVELALESDQPLNEEQLAAISVESLASGEPERVPGGWEVFPDVHGAYGSFTVPPGPAQITTDGWGVSDAQSDIGSTALLAGSQLDLSGTDSGLAFGSRQCALYDRIDGGIPASVGEAWAEYLGHDPTAVEQFSVTGTDSSDVSIVFDPATQTPAVILVAGNRPVTAADFERYASTSFCDPVPAGIGDASIRAICPDGTRRLYWYSGFRGPDGPMDHGRTFTVEVPPSMAADVDDASMAPLFDLPLSQDELDLVSALEDPFLIQP